jgi:NADPH-dependent 2,4-dienoyl-CoA reductase/sulfur reductase-like enzyme
VWITDDFLLLKKRGFFAIRHVQLWKLNIMNSAKRKIDVLVVGAGLSGLSVSISCALAGHKVTVLESAKVLSEV